MEMLTVAQIAEKLGVSSKTVHRYWERHKEFLKYQKKGSAPLVISKESLNVLYRMRDLYIHENLKRNVVQERLEEEGYHTIYYESEPEPVLQSVPRDTETQEANTALMEEVKRQFLELQELKTRVAVVEAAAHKQDRVIDKQDKIIEQQEEKSKRLEERVRQLEGKDRGSNQGQIQEEITKESNALSVEEQSETRSEREKNNRYWPRLWKAFLGRK